MVKIQIRGFHFSLAIYINCFKLVSFSIAIFVRKNYNCICNYIIWDVPHQSLEIVE